MQYTTVQDVSQYTEVSQLQVQAASKNSSAENIVSNSPKVTAEAAATPWHFFGIFQDDPQWGQIFDEIERRRDEWLIGG